MTITDTEINTIIAARERLTNRRDEQIDWVAVDHFDAVLAQVPAGTRNDVDLLLGRPAELPERVEYQLRPATDTAAATEAVAELAQKKHDEFIACLVRVYDEWLDYERIKRDLAI